MPSILCGLNGADLLALIVGLIIIACLITWAQGRES